MFALTNKPEMGARFYNVLVQLSSRKIGLNGDEYDAMQMMQHLAGVLAETYLVFEQPDEVMQASFISLGRKLGCNPQGGDLWMRALPPAHVIDFETERGRNAARLFFEDWLDCGFELHDLILGIAHQVIVSWEVYDFDRAESYRLLIELVRRSMAYEIAAQELCDVVIERKVGEFGWCLGDCISALSAVSGRRIALSLNSNTCEIFKGCDIPDNLDNVVYVMTQEATRLGVPVGTDWRFGLAANDMPINAPVELINAVEPYCKSFFRAIKLDGHLEQAVCCAKAAGRMIAVAAGGELPEIEPAIAKPLAMSAMTESYKHVCRSHVNFG